MAASKSWDKAKDAAETVGTSVSAIAAETCDKAIDVADNVGDEVTAAGIGSASSTRG